MSARFCKNYTYTRVSPTLPVFRTFFAPSFEQDLFCMFKLVFDVSMVFRCLLAGLLKIDRPAGIDS